MKNLKLYFCLLIIFFVNSGSYAQSEEDLEELFKYWLILDKKMNNHSNIPKNDSTFSLFNDALKLSLDYSSSTSLGSKYIVLHLKFYDLENDDFITGTYKYKNKKYSSSELYNIPAYSDIGKYTLIYNVSNKKSYRIIGFNNNDFLSFLSDFKEENFETYGEKISTKKFLRKYQIEGIDFKCLYKGLRSSKRNKKKYPCLIRSSDIELKEIG